MNINTNNNETVYLSHTNGEFTKPRTYWDVCENAGISFGKLAYLHHQWKNENGSDMIALDNGLVLIFK